MFMLLALENYNNSPLVDNTAGFFIRKQMTIHEWLNKVLKRSMKTIKFSNNDNNEVDWSNIPMTTVPDEFKERIKSESNEKRLQDMENET